MCSEHCHAMQPALDCASLVPCLSCYLRSELVLLVLLELLLPLLLSGPGKPGRLLAKAVSKPPVGPSPAGEPSTPPLPLPPPLPPTTPDAAFFASASRCHLDITGCMM